MTEESIAMSDTEEVVCSCGAKLFKHLISMRKVSSLLTKTGRTEYAPVPVIVCNSCEKVFERERIIV